jgi:hypothetical protein
MTSSELENLVGIGKLKREPASAREYDGLVRSGEARLADARNEDLSLDSRFDLAYNAAHALALAALRRQGYRSENRVLVFQLLTSTLGLPSVVWRVLAKWSRSAKRLGVRGLVRSRRAFGDRSRQPPEMPFVRGEQALEPHQSGHGTPREPIALLPATAG